jgi:glucan phosphoethanolaminetransferase (alkaline phosphatase superfamily)
MKLEHRKQQVVSLPRFFLRLWRYSLVCIILIVFSVSIGMLGYHFVGDLNGLDSFYMASMILTGMGPVAEMKTQASKLFSSFYALYSGIAFLSITAVFFAPIIHRVLHILQVEVDDVKS